MAEINYCTASDLYDFGVPRGTLQNPAQLIASVDTAADTFELNLHGFELNHPVTFRPEAGGELPAPLVEGTTYYAIPTSDNVFQVAAAVDDNAVELTSQGERILVIASMPIDAAISWASRILDDMLPAHVLPLESPLPSILRITAAELAAFKLVGYRGNASKSLTELFDAAKRRLERWAQGVPIRGENAPTSAQVAVTSAAPADARGWRRWGGTC